MARAKRTLDLLQQATLHDGALGDKAANEGLEVPGYRLFDLVGHGGAGEVFRAQRQEDGAVVALKVLRREYCFDSLMLSRFEREIQAISMLTHPNIVKIYDVGRSNDGRPFFAMEFVRGQTLRERIQSSPRLTPHQAVALFSEVGYAIAYAHDRGIVHRDLKSTNVIVLDHHEGAPGVKLVDFGVAKFLRPQKRMRGLTRQGTMLGSTSAMSPEQIRGQPIDRRADIYGMGVLLFELLTGELPFRALEVSDLLRLHLDSPVPLPSQRHRPVYAFDAVVKRALQKRREDRFESARDFVDAAQLALARPGLVPRSTCTPVQAVGLCARIETEQSALQDPAALLDLTLVQRGLRRLMEQSGYLTPITTPSVLLGIRVVPQDPALARTTLDKARILLERFGAFVMDRQDPHPSNDISLTLHVDKAQLAAQDQRIISGPILSYEDWSFTGAAARRDRLRVTPSFDRALAQAT